MKKINLASLVFCVEWNFNSFRKTARYFSVFIHLNYLTINKVFRVFSWNACLLSFNFFVRSVLGLLQMMIIGFNYFRCPSECLDFRLRKSFYLLICFLYYAFNFFYIFALHVFRL